ncbi:hypothetical protein KY342_00085 [Candidatus Woesearchaeota archaeon]|nr:hypothetical protein [Candidatus Woesearchaeota archaeon]
MDKSDDLKNYCIRYLQNKRAYKTCRRLFRDSYRNIVNYKHNNVITRSQFDDTVRSIRLGILTLEYLNSLKKNYGLKYPAIISRLNLERQILRRRVDELREIVSDPDKEIVSDLEGRVD